MPGYIFIVVEFCCSSIFFIIVVSDKQNDCEAIVDACGVFYK
jgi:hypothetical protein